MTRRRQRAHVHLESDGQRRGRTDGLDGLVHPQDVRPQLFVTECVVAEDGLTVLSVAGPPPAQTPT